MAHREAARKERPGEVDPLVREPPVGGCGRVPAGVLGYPAGDDGTAEHARPRNPDEVTHLAAGAVVVLGLEAAPDDDVPPVAGQIEQGEPRANARALLTEIDEETLGP